MVVVVAEMRKNLVLMGQFLSFTGNYAAAGCDPASDKVAECLKPR
jgi:hypothetical protein